MTELEAFADLERHAALLQLAGGPRWRGKPMLIDRIELMREAVRGLFASSDHDWAFGYASDGDGPGTIIVEPAAGELGQLGYALAVSALTQTVARQMREACAPASEWVRMLEAIEKAAERTK